MVAWVLVLSLTLWILVALVEVVVAKIIVARSFSIFLILASTPQTAAFTFKIALRRLFQRAMTVPELPHTVFCDKKFASTFAFPPKLGGYDLYQKVFKSPKLIVAPMVDQSELAWRIISRRYGADLCFTPMLHARLFNEQPSYAHEVFSTNAQDRPLIVQFCANDPETLLQAATKVAPYCDAIDLNLGCPQGIARKGHYGAFLQDDWGLITNLISTLHEKLPIPVTAKIRIFKDPAKTLAYARMVHDAGAQMITVHGRTREQKGQVPGPADWDMIKMIRDDPHLKDVPIIANGNLNSPADVIRCLEYTKCDGVMTAEANLGDPAFFAPLSRSPLSLNSSISQPHPLDLAIEYLDICRQTPTQFSSAKSHLFRLCRPWFKGACTNATDLREELSKSVRYINRKIPIVSPEACDKLTAMLRELKRRIDAGEVHADISGTTTEDTIRERPGHGTNAIRLEDGHSTLHQELMT